MANGNPLSVIQQARREGIRPAGEGSPIFNVTGRVGQQEASQAARDLALRKVRQLQEQGITGTQAVRSLLNSPEFVDALVTVPDVAEFATGILDAAREPEQTVSKSEIPAEMFDKLPELAPEQQAFLGADAGQDLTAIERNTNALIEAEEAGDERRADILRRQILSQSGGTTPASQALKMRAAGLSDTGNKFVNEMSDEQARKAMTLGNQRGAPSIQLNDLAVRALGEKTGKANVDELAPEAAEAAFNARTEAMGSDDVLSALLGMAQNPSATGGAAGVPTPGQPGGEQQSIFQRFRGDKTAEEAPEQQGRPEPPVATQETASAPTAPGNLTPERVEQMSIEELQDVAQRFIKGELDLPEEVYNAVRERLLAAAE